MQQITIFTGEENEEDFKNHASEFTKDSKDSITFTFKDFLNRYLKRDLPNLSGKSIVIDQIPNWELIKIYRVILNLECKTFTLFVHYKAEDLINKYE